MAKQTIKIAQSSVVNEEFHDTLNKLLEYLENQMKYCDKYY